MENDEINYFEEPENADISADFDDTADEVFEEELVPKQQSITDVPSFQVILCLIAAVGLVVFNIVRPEAAEDLLNMLKNSSADPAEIIGDPIGFILELLA